MKLRNFTWRPSSDGLILFSLTGGAIVLGLLGLGDLALRDWDEGYYGTVARDIVQRDNWLFPTYLGEPFLLKPPLILWLLALAYRGGGIDEFSSRWPCAILSALAVPLLYGVGREIFSSPAPARYSSLTYLTLLPVARHGRLAMIDGTIDSLLLLAIWAGLRSRKSPPWAIGVGVSLGAIALAKGVIVLALGAILLIFWVWDRQGKISCNPYLWLGLIIGMSPVLAWYGIQIAHYGSEFIDTHFKSQGFDRLATSVEGNRGSPVYYLFEILKYSAPWLFFLPSGMGLAWQNRRETSGKLILSFFTLYLLLISLMGTKLPWYVMPVYPFFALAVGMALAQLQAACRPYPKYIALLLGLCAAIALVGLAYFWRRGEVILVGMAGVLAATMAIAAWLFWQRQARFIAVTVGGLYLSLALFFLSSEWIWELNESFAVKPVGQLVRSQVPPQIKVYISFPYGRPSLDFYSGRRVMEADISRLQELSTRPNYFLLDAPALAALSLPPHRILGKAGDFTLIQTQPKPGSPS